MCETMHHDNKPEPVLPNDGAHKLWHDNNRRPETYESAVRQGVCWADGMLWALGYAIGRASDEEALAILADEDRVTAILEDNGRFLDLLLPVGEWPTVSNHALGGEQVADYCEGVRLMCNHNPTEEWLCVAIQRPDGATWWLWVDAWMGSPVVQTTDAERGTQVVRYEVEIVPTMLVEGERRIIWRGDNV